MGSPVHDGKTRPLDRASGFLPGCEFLQVTAFLGTEPDARAIKSAMDLGILDALNEGGATPLAALSAAHHVHPRGLQVLLDMLEVNNVLARRGELVDLTPEFRSILPMRDLLALRIEFADLVWPDIHELFTPLLTDLPQFMARSKTFELFRYDRCFVVTPENLDATRRWTKFTTCLTKYEAGAALDLIGLDGVETLVDLGGNTGEFALQACRRSATLRAIVVDLPVVCELGRQHLRDVASAEEAARIGFSPADMRENSLPGGADLVSFKSVLHDWGDADTCRLLRRAHALLRPGGRLVIFERGPIDLRGKRLSYAMAPELVFLHFLRPPDLYLKTLGQLGFEEIEHRRLMLDMEFHLITARRPDGVQDHPRR